MSVLTLKPDGKLIETRWNPSTARDPGYHEEDISHQVPSRLFDLIRLDPRLRLVDIFLLLSREPILQSFCTRDYAKELIAEIDTLLGQPNLPPPRGDGQPDQGEIEFLELFFSWDRDSVTGELSGTNRLHLHGVGAPLAFDMIDGGHLICKAGERINWSLTFTSPAQIAHLPLRFNPNVRIYENDTSSHRWGQVVDSAIVTEPTLGQVLMGVLWDLSYHGAGAERDNLQKELLGRWVAETIAASIDNPPHPE